MWRAFGSADMHGKEHPEERNEVACALMAGGVFHFIQGQWRCYDDTSESNINATGAWNFKVNAARAFLSTKGVFFDKQGNPVERSIASG